MPPERTAFLSVRISRGVSTPSTRSPAARSKRRTLVRVAGPNCAVGRGGIAELRERVLQQAHVLALRADAQAADAEPAAVAGAAALRAARGRLRKRCVTRAERSRPGVGAQRAHHRRPCAARTARRRLTG